VRVPLYDCRKSLPTLCTVNPPLLVTVTLRVSVTRDTRVVSPMCLWLNRPATLSPAAYPADRNRSSFATLPTSSSPDRRTRTRFALRCADPSCQGVKSCKRSPC
jgi:hypothetical protein